MTILLGLVVGVGRGCFLYALPRLSSLGHVHAAPPPLPPVQGARLATTSDPGLLEELLRGGSDGLAGDDDDEPRIRVAPPPPAANVAAPIPLAPQTLPGGSTGDVAGGPVAAAHAVAAPVTGMSAGGSGGSRSSGALRICVPTEDAEAEL